MHWDRGQFIKRRMQSTNGVATQCFCWCHPTPATLYEREHLTFRLCQSLGSVPSCSHLPRHVGWEGKKRRCRESLRHLDWRNLLHTRWQREVSKISTFAFLATGQKAAPCQKGMIQASVANSSHALWVFPPPSVPQGSEDSVYHSSASHALWAVRRTRVLALT